MTDSPPMTRLVVLLRTLEGAAAAAAEDVAKGMEPAEAVDAVLDAAANLRGFLDDIEGADRPGSPDDGPPPFHGVGHDPDATIDEPLDESVDGGCHMHWPDAHPRCSMCGGRP